MHVILLQRFTSSRLSTSPAERTDGFSRADLRAIISEAQLAAVQAPGTLQARERLAGSLTPSTLSTRALISQSTLTLSWFGILFCTVIHAWEGPAMIAMSEQAVLCCKSDWTRSPG
jgi:hypothetical protein